MSPFAAAILATALAAPVEPTPAAVSRAVERCKGSVVKVVGGGRGDAVLVGPRGELLTVGSVARSDKLSVLIGSERYSARVVRRDDETRAVLASIEPASDFRPPAVAKAARLVPGSYLIVLGHQDGLLTSAVARMSLLKKKPREQSFRLDAGVRAGSPVFTTRGELVAIQSETGVERPRTLAIDWVRERFGSGNPAAP